MHESGIDSGEPPSIAARVADSNMEFTPGRLGNTKPGVQSDWTRP